MYRVIFQKITPHTRYIIRRTTLFRQSSLGQFSYSVPYEMKIFLLPMFWKTATTQSIVRTDSPKSAIVFNKGPSKSKITNSFIFFYFTKYKGSVKQTQKQSKFTNPKFRTIICPLRPCEESPPENNVAPISSSRK